MHQILQKNQQNILSIEAEERSVQAGRPISTTEKMRPTQSSYELEASNSKESKIPLMKSEIPDIYYFFLGLLIVILSSFSANAQDISFNHTIPTEVTTCGDIESFTVEFTNNSGSTISGVQVSVALPTGMVYEGGLTETSSYNVTATNTSGSTLSFTTDNVPDEGVVSFDFNLSAGFAAMTAFQAGTVFTNTVTVSHNGGSDADQTDSYNILYAALSVVTVTPMSSEVFVGETFTRTVTIVNGGYGSVSSFVVGDVEGSNITLDAVDIGTLNPSTNEITFSSADISGFGDGDGYFEQNEQIIFTQTVTASGCDSDRSEITAYWGCDGQTTASNTKYPYTTIELFAPSLSVTPTPNFNTCFDGANPETLTITNNGSGPANEIVLYIDIGRQWSNTRLDETSVTYSMGAATDVSVTPFTTYNNLQPACLGENPVSKFEINLPTIQPGATLTLNWDSYTCDAPYCSDIDLYEWDYGMDYTDMCNSKTYTKSGVGSPRLEKNMSITGESPSDLSDAQTGNFTFEITSGYFNMPEGTNPYFEVIFDIPVGLVWSGTSTDLNWKKNNTTWTPSSVTYNSSTRELTAIYPWSMAFTNLTYSIFDLDLTVDCSQLSGSKIVTVGMQMFYIADSSCPSPHHLPYSCYESVDSYIHCPSPCAHGMRNLSFDVERTTFGAPDNDADGYADASGSLDMTKIKTNRVMENDTFNTVFFGTVKTSGSSPTFTHGYSQSRINEFGDKLEILSASVEIYDASSGSTITCNNVAYSSATSGTDLTVDFDYSPATLSSGCSALTGFIFDNDDEVTLTATYRVTGNVGTQIEQITFPNDLWVSDQADGTVYQCDYRAGNITFVGYNYHSWGSNQYNITDCDVEVQQGFFAYVGTSPAGGNPFPYEYRNWSRFNQLRVNIPEGYTVTNTYFRFRNNKALGTTQDVVVNPVAISSQVGQDVYYDMDALYEDNGGTVPLSDDGYQGYVYVTLEPDCDVNPSANLPVRYYMNFKEIAKLGGGITNEKSGGADYLKYYPAQMKVSTTLQYVDGNFPTASWTVKLKNNSNSPAPNAWLNLDIPAAMTLLSTEVGGSAITPDANGFYQLGEFSANETRTYTVTVEYDDCNMSSLTATSGYACSGYPTDLATYDCQQDEMDLFLVPQPSELQTKIFITTNPLDPCDNSISVEIEMLSSKLANVVDVFASIDIPANQSITIESGTAEFKHPISGSYVSISDPTLVGSNYTIDAADMSATLGMDGLVGVTDITSNTARLKFNLLLDNNYKPGDFTTLSVGGNRPCGDALPTLSMVYDPSSTFGKPEGIGLGESDNNWAVAWGDYDNDGNVDLFVTNYEVDEANLLYHNNGDGTFTKVTTGAIATDVASSLSATWGDYDNDGDLDLFVANNIGFNNFLYRNNGNSTFTRIQNDPLVNDVYYSHGAAWADYDNDGFLDMFVADYFSTRFNRLYHNNGDGTFSEVTNSSINLEADFSVNGVWGDYDNDGLIDLFVSNTNGSDNSLYKNMGNGQFLKINTGDIVNDGGYSVGASWGDCNNDGYLDLFVANAANEDNFLYQNDGDGTFTKITTGDVVNDAGNSHGSSWVDVDNDGDLDLFVANDQDENNFLYTNNGDGTFTPVVNAITQDGGQSFGAAWADYDNDGDMDLYVANHESNENFIYENERGYCQGKACLTISGTNSNASAIGARVRVKANIYGQDVWQMREVSSQTGGGVGGQNDMKLIFGVGDATQVDSIIINWPSGYEQILTNQALTNCTTITEPNGNIICGKVYDDKNDDCTFDAGDKPIANQKIIIQPGDRVAYTDSLGNYSSVVEAGTYTIEYLDDSNNWMASESCANQTTIVVSGVGNTYCDNNVELRPECPNPDLEVDLVSTAHRVGFQNLIAITYRNTGTEDATGVDLTVDFGQYVIPLSATIPWDLEVGEDRRWVLGDVAVGEAVTIYVTDSVSTATPIDTDISITATLYGNEADCDGANNSITETAKAVGAIDPNDILVSPEGYIDAGTTLTYKIRFQNVGNTLVSTVRVEDQLPIEYLDMNTFVMGMVSHPYRLDVEDGHMTWTFDNIDMPDSLTNEPASHGYIIFKVKTKEDLEDGVFIDNTAEIYFDNQDPIITNTVTNIIGRPAVPEGKNGTVLIYPNPMDETSTFQIIPNRGTDPEEIESIFVYDVLGHEVFNKIGVQEKYYDMTRFSSMKPGLYIVKAISAGDRKEYIGKLIVR